MENQNNALSLNTQNSQGPFTPQGPSEKSNVLTPNKPNESPISKAPLWKQPPALTALEKPKWDEKDPLDKVMKGNLLLKPGSENKKEVSELQDLLREKGYKINDSNGLYRGVYGEQTKKAVARFQKMQGLVPDGVVGPKTLKALKEYDYRPVVLPEGLSLKGSSVDISHLHSKVQAAFPTIVKIWKDNEAHSPIITSGNDSQHTSSNSLHYSDRAVDLRGNNVSDAKLRKMADALREQLGSGYFVKAEFFPENPNNDHIHIGYDPKRYQ